MSVALTLWELHPTRHLLFSRPDHLPGPVVRRNEQLSHQAVDSLSRQPVNVVIDGRLHELRQVRV